jgi:HK97 family phage major capsid protein
MSKLDALQTKLAGYENRVTEFANLIAAGTQLTDEQMTEMRTLKSNISKVSDEIEVVAMADEIETRAAGSEFESRNQGQRPPSGRKTPESEKIAQRFSISRAVQLASGKTTGTTDYGLEKEMNAEGLSIARASGLQTEDKPSIFLPDTIFGEKRSDAGTALNAGNLIPTSQHAVREGYRPRLWLEDLGVNVMTALPGQNNMPVSDYLADGGIVGEADMTPATVAANVRRPAFSAKGFYSKIINGWYLQALAGDVASQELFKVLLRAEANIINKTSITRGSGTIASEGLLDLANVTDVTGTNGDAITRSLLIDMINAPASNDAEFSEPAWIVSPAIRKKLQKEIITSGDASFVWDLKDPGMLLGYKAGVTSHMPTNLSKGTGGAVKHGVVFGHFSEFIIMRWPVRQLIINPYSNNDGVENKLISFYDWNTPNPKAFAKGYFTV